MIWLVVGLLGVLAGVCIWRAVDGCDEVGWIMGAVFSSIFCVIMLIVLPCLTISNTVGLAQLEMFYEENTYNYECAIDITASYLSAEDFKDKLVAGSLEKIEQAGYVSNRISEWTKAVNNFNSEVARMKAFNHSVFLGVLFPDAIENLKPLRIQ